MKGRHRMQIQPLIVSEGLGESGQKLSRKAKIIGGEEDTQQWHGGPGLLCAGVLHEHGRGTPQRAEVDSMTGYGI